MLRWGKRIGLIIGGLIVAAVLAGVGYEQVMRWRAAQEYPAQGRLIDIGGRHMQIDCRGNGAPTVVFESGLDTMGSLSWSAVHDAVASTTRACAYSRAGIMWSEPRTDKFEPDSEARDLHTLLLEGSPRPPGVAYEDRGPRPPVRTCRYAPRPHRFPPGCNPRPVCAPAPDPSPR